MTDFNFEELTFIPVDSDKDSWFEWIWYEVYDQIWSDKHNGIFVHKNQEEEFKNKVKEFHDSLKDK